MCWEWCAISDHGLRSCREDGGLWWKYCNDLLGCAVTIGLELVGCICQAYWGVFDSSSGVSRLSIVGWWAPLVPIRHSQVRVGVLDIIILSDNSVSSMETEWIDSSKVFGIFWASAIWSSVVARLLNVIDWCSGMRFLASKKFCASSGIWVVVQLSGLVGWVSCNNCVVCGQVSICWGWLGWLAFWGWGRCQPSGWLCWTSEVAGSCNVGWIGFWSFLGVGKLWVCSG